MPKYGSWTLLDIVKLLETIGEANARRLLKGELEFRILEASMPRYPVTIDYPNPPEALLEHQIERLGCNFTNLDVNPRNFPVTGSGVMVVTLTLVEFGKPMTTEEVLKEFDNRALKRPKVEHGLAFGAQYPNAQRAGPIGILCEPWQHPDGEWYVPYLDGDANARYMHLHDMNHGWDARWRFLVVRDE